MKEFCLRTLLLSFAHVCLFCGSWDGACAQDAAPRGLTWQHNGQVFSIRSRGPSGRRGTGPPVVVVSSGNGTAGPPRAPAASGAAQLRAVTRQRPPPRSGSAGDPAGGREDGMVGDDPYNPYKSSNYYPYYNYYNSYYRPRARSPARHGYGTSFHQNGTNRAEPHRSSAPNASIKLQRNLLLNKVNRFYL